MTAVYSLAPHPYDPLKPQPLWDREEQHVLRLPWPMEKLAGSRWRNIHTGTLVHVTGLAPQRRASQGPTLKYRHVAPLAQAGDVNLSTLLDELGLWWNGRYLVEHWTRIDLLPPKEQWAWFEAEARHIQVGAEIALAGMREYAAHPEYSCAAINYRLKEHDLAYRRAEMEATRRAADSFLRRHALPQASTQAFVIPEPSAKPRGLIIRRKRTERRGR